MSLLIFITFLETLTISFAHCLTCYMWLKQFKAWVKGFYEEKSFIRDNFNKLNDTELKFGR